jgi:DNA-binding NarL/FixJ family response regulator
MGRPPGARGSKRRELAAGREQFRLAGMHPGDRSDTVDAMTLRCVIVDDSGVFVAAARSLLEHEGMTVVGAASNGAEALRLAADVRPDVLLVDIDLGGESGLELITHLVRSADPAPPVILISTHAEEDYADLVAESPAVGFLPKPKLSATAIRQVLDGRSDIPAPPIPGPGER